MIEKCPFCLEWLNQNPKIKKYGLDTSVLYETYNWYVVPSIGGFLPGYLLIVNKKHYPSIALCPDNTYKELEDIIKLCRKTLFELYKIQPILYEHGSFSKISEGANSIDHVHLHIVPSSIDLLPAMPTKTELITDFKELKQRVMFDKNPYLLYENELGIKYYTKFNSRYYSSQHFRKYITENTKITADWNWRETEFEDLFINTFYEVKNYLSIKNRGDA